MKKILLLMLILSSPVLASYTYMITDGMDLNDIGTSRLTGHQSLLMTGGGGGLLSLSDNSSAIIQKTAPYNQQIYPRGGINEIGVGAYAHLDFLGGEVYQIGIGSYGTATISGGMITRLGSSQIAWKWDYSFDPPKWVPNPHVEIICREYNFNTATNKLNGIWNIDADGNGQYDLFNIQILNDPTTSPTIENIKFTIIPEPMTLALLALGGLLIRKK